MHHRQKDHEADNHDRRAFWGKHLNLLALLLTLGGIVVILVSRYGLSNESASTIFAVGGTSLLLGHIAAFGGAFLLGGGWVTKLYRKLAGQGERQS